MTSVPGGVRMADVRILERSMTPKPTSPILTAGDKLAAVERELSYRRRVYARRVMECKMSAELAARQIAVFEAIRDDYAKAEQGERLI